MYDERKMDTINQDSKNSKDRKELERPENDFSKKYKQNVKIEETCENENIVSEENSEQRQKLLEIENTELRDKVMRLAADMENLRRRTERDIADAKSYSIAGFARDMLSVLDNLARALVAVSPKACENDLGLKSLVDGVEMTKRAMMSTLQRHGVQKIESLGQKFDPNFHQAMFELNDSSVPANTITQVVQDGYVIGERVLRSAMVGITKGGPKSETLLKREDIEKIEDKNEDNGDERIKH